MRPAFLACNRERGQSRPAASGLSRAGPSVWPECLARVRRADLVPFYFIAIGLIGPLTEPVTINAGAVNRKS